MPGYIIHLTEAGWILRHLEQRQGHNFDEGWRRRFLLGSLLPDTKRKQEKSGSHFWDPGMRQNLALAPELSRFEEKYGREQTDPGMLGYWAHLHLDEAYVDHFWPEILEFRDEKGQTQTLRSQIRQVWLKKQEILVPVEDFFSGEWYYGDYSRMNAWFTIREKLAIPEYRPEEWAGWALEEADPGDLPQVLRELARLLENQKPGDEKNLKVFPLDMLEQFMRDTAEEAAAEILSRSSGIPGA